MITFLVRTCLFKLVTLLIISIVSFLIIHLAPGEPSQIDPLNPRFQKEDLERYRKTFNLDKPLHIQYFLFYKKFFSGELRSFKDNQPVFPKIWERFLNSLPLFIVGTILTWGLAFPLGVSSSLNQDSLIDKGTTFCSYLLISMPSFFLAYLLIIATVNFLETPVLGIQTFGQEDSSFLFKLNDRIWHLVLPSLLGATAGIAVLSRYVRAQMLEVINQDFTQTAHSKGLSQERVYYIHVLRNAALPFVTMFGLILPSLIGGSVIIESIFAWPGMGRMAFEAILTRDYPIILSLNFISAVLVILGTFISDILLVAVDPRIRL